MDARSYLVRLAALMNEHGLEAVLLGNAGAAIQGVPITTVDIDFFVRKTPRNRPKIKGIAKSLNAELYRPFYPASSLIRLMRDDGLQIDFMSYVDGLRSFEGVKARASKVNFDGASMLVASLEDIIKSKKAANRLKDQAALPILERSLEEEKTKPKGSSRRAAERE